MTQKKQAVAPPTLPIGREAFEKNEKTTVYWLGGAGALINSRGTLLMVDPVLEGFEMPQLRPAPLSCAQVPALDGVLITHSDGDHYSEASCLGLAPVCPAFHATLYGAGLMKKAGLPALGHPIGDSFSLGRVRVRLTPADHCWQQDQPEPRGYVFRPEDCCGFWLETPDGTIWAPGDSRLMEEHLSLPEPDLIFFDFSEDSWHIGLGGAQKLAETYPRSRLILWHWGTVDAPDLAPFNGDPQEILRRIPNPERAFILAPGEAFSLRPLS